MMLLLCLGLSHSYAQTPDTTASHQDLEELADAVNSTIDLRTETLSDSINMLSDSLAQLKQVLSVSDYYDSASVAALMKDASSLYAPSECKKYDWIHIWLGWLLFAVVLLGGLFLFARTGMCRDDSYKENGELRPYKERPYSYSRVQLFWWTMIILCCYIGFFAKTGNLIPLNLTTIVLLGLGVTTYAGGKIIDERQKNRLPVGQRNQDKNSECENLFEDILSDDSGISIHRFQTIIFNIAFGIGFVSYFIMAICSHKYPFDNFNEWQFALLGISAATYLGIKTAENSTTTRQKQTPQNPDQA